MNIKKNFIILARTSNILCWISEINYFLEHVHVPVNGKFNSYIHNEILKGIQCNCQNRYIYITLWNESFCLAKTSNKGSSCLYINRGKIGQDSCIVNKAMLTVWLFCSYLLAMSLQQEQQMTDEELAWKHSQQPQEHAQISE